MYLIFFDIKVPYCYSIILFLELPADSKFFNLEGLTPSGKRKPAKQIISKFEQIMKSWPAGLSSAVDEVSAKEMIIGVSNLPSEKVDLVIVFGKTLRTI